jgi:hypothetical protein
MWYGRIMRECGVTVNLPTIEWALFVPLSEDHANGPLTRRWTLYTKPKLLAVY